MPKCDSMRLKVTVCVKEKPCVFVELNFLIVERMGVWECGLVGGVLFRVCCKIDSK